MDVTFWLNVFMRWLHVASAVAAVGGLLLMRFAVLPALSGRPNAAELYGAVQAGLKKVLHSALGLAILTGLYNYGVVAVGAYKRVKEAHPDLGLLASYHPVAGVKMLLSFVLFGAAIALLKPADTLPEAKKGPLTVNVVLGLVILLLGAYLRRLWPVPMP
jgi:hypothetical protein